jgi:arylsulfatase A-like enzyme
VYGNSPPNGGWTTFHDNGMEEQTIAVALHDAGYRTALIGKYLNGFSTDPRGVMADYVPPGWSRFLTFKTEPKYYNYTLTDDSVHGDAPRDYSADVLRRRAVDFINGTPSNRPLFLMWTPFNPHTPARAAPRDVGSFAGKLRSYRPPSVTDDVSDKPPWIQSLDPVPQKAIDTFRTNQVESLQSVDDAVGVLLNALADSHRLSQTLFIFTSDNAVLWGDHRGLGKDVPYRFPSDIPLIMRWDGHIPAGTIDRRLAANVDLTATIANAAGISMTTTGLNLLGSQGRQAIVLEARTKSFGDGSFFHPAYCGLRTKTSLFVHYAEGTEELYDYNKDPYETTNVASRPAYADQLASMRATTAAGCLPTPPGFSW